MISRKFPETLDFKAVSLVELTTKCSMKKVITYGQFGRFGHLEPRSSLKKNRSPFT